jgi:hypothetical protein
VERFNATFSFISDSKIFNIYLGFKTLFLKSIIRSDGIFDYKIFRIPFWVTNWRILKLYNNKNNNLIVPL